MFWEYAYVYVFCLFLCIFEQHSTVFSMFNAESTDTIFY
jgi:hypothetical protein